MLIVPASGGGLPFLLPTRFERFYRERLRRVAGSRLRSAVLLGAYQRWATEAGEGALSFKLMRQCLEAIGHPRRKSDGICYLDIAFVEDAGSVPDTLDFVVSTGPALARTSAANSVMIAKVDALLSAALELRTALVAAEEAQTPHEAAMRVLGLFDR